MSRSPSRCHPCAPLGFNHVPPWLHACHPWPRAPSTGGTRAALRPQSSSPSRRSAVEDGHPSGGFPASIICSSTTQQPWRRRAGGARPRGHDARDWRAGPVAPAGTRGREELTGARGTEHQRAGTEQRHAEQWTGAGEERRERGREGEQFITN